MPSAQGVVTLAARPLTAAAFRPFGQVIEAPGREGRAANQGTARRFDDVAALALDAAGGRAQMSVFRVRPVAFPVSCRFLERHPLSSQAFVALGGRRFLVVVAPPGGDAPDARQASAFVTDGRQGVNYGPGTWHHPVLALDSETDFAVLGRADPAGGDCDIADFRDGLRLSVLAPAGD